MDLLGGQYPADQNADGTWNIRGLPIFGENTRKFGKREMVVDREWLEEAVRFASESARSGYLAPLHVRHHADSPHAPNQAEHVGFVRPTHVAPMTYEGKQIAALYADYLSVPEDAFERFRRKQMPYVSVEAPIDEKRICSAAILTDEEPFFRMPMQTIGATEPYVIASVLIDREPVTAGAPTLAAFRAPKGVSFLSNFSTGGVPMSHVTQEQLDALKSDMDAKFTSLTATIENGFAKFAAAGPAKPDDAQGADDGTSDEGDDDDANTGVESGPVSASQINDAKFAAETIKMQARLDTLEDTVAKAQAKDAETARYNAAKAELETDGYHISTSRSDSLKTYAAQGDKALAAYVAAMREFPPDPPETIDGLTRGASRRGTDSDAVATFGAGDPDKLAFAREAEAQFAQLKAAGAPVAGSLEQFIATKSKYSAQVAV